MKKIVVILGTSFIFLTAICLIFYFFVEYRNGWDISENKIAYHDAILVVLTSLSVTFTIVTFIVVVFAFDQFSRFNRDIEVATDQAVKNRLGDQSSTDFEFKKEPYNKEKIYDSLRYEKTNSISKENGKPDSDLSDKTNS